VLSKLLIKPNKSEKIYMIDDHVACAVAGLTADASVLITYLRRAAQQHRLQYQEPMPMEPLVQRVCDLKQGYTQYGGMRPFGVSFIYAGFDSHYGFQLYQSDPSGNYNGWKATAIGANHLAAESLLKSAYKEGMPIEEALQLAVRVLTKTMDATSPTPEKMEFTVLRRHPRTGKLTQQVLPDDQVAVLLSQTKDADADEGDA
jgi:20S proteasome subunit alpha 3